MRTIHKYHLSGPDMADTLLMHEGAIILCAQMQRQKYVMWAVVDDTRPKEKRVFGMFGTGTNLGADAIDYVSTVQDGLYVWHIFELPRPAQ